MIAHAACCRSTFAFLSLRHNMLLLTLLSLLDTLLPTSPLSLVCATRYAMLCRLR